MKHNNIPSVKYTTVEGQEMINLLPNNQSRQAAIIDFSVLQRIIAHLPQVDLYTIRGRFMDKLKDTDSIEQYIQVVEDELAFHKTVNVIRTVEAENFENVLSES